MTMRKLELSLLVAVVAAWAFLREPTQIRHEILLGKAPAKKVTMILKKLYPDVRFIDHATLNGFYVEGDRDDVLAIEKSIPDLDRLPDVPPPAYRECGLAH